MSLSVGIDIGAVSVKAAILGAEEDRPVLDALVRSGEFARLSCPRPVVISECRRGLGDPLGVAHDLLAAVKRLAPGVEPDRLRGTGCGAGLLQERRGILRVNDGKAIAAAMGLVHPEVATVFEMGGESSRFLRLHADEGTGQVCLQDYETNGDCAAGTGAFIDQQATRLRYRIEDVGSVACAAPSAARIAGRCSVFAKSDMIHAQQKGASPPQILRGLCDAVARNFKGSITKGKPVVPPVAFIGGLARNAGVVQALRELFRFDERQLFVPEAYAWFGAIGAALLGAGGEERRAAAAPGRPSAALPAGGDGEGAVTRPLSLEHVLLLRDRVRPYRLPDNGDAHDAYLGIDIGSVSTNLVVLNDAAEVMHEIYVRTDARPIQVVTEGLRTIASALGERVRIRGVGTTGSGRELIGELVGADTITDEITAHKTGAMYVSQTLLGEQVDTIFEIGGQDAKFIALQDGVVVDFAMNEACAAGTGSFLEEQAERLGISIKGEFSDLAFRSEQPARLGERCTVFMEQDVVAWQQRGAAREDLVAGLAYSVALNYLNRVVRGRRIGDVIYFQGGTAYNDAVAAAFAGLLGKRIIVPPHNGVVGAIGMALLAREKVQGTNRPTTFRGFDLSTVRYTLREFVCKACSNVCDMEEFTVEGVKTYWGDKCSDKFRTRRRTERQPAIPDLMAVRRERLLDGYAGPRGSGPRVGFPRAMSFHDRFPFWRAFLEELGCAVILSDDTNRKIAQDGIDLSVAEPCYPIRVAHGHVQDLLEEEVDWLLLPNVINVEPTPDAVESQLCPWAQTLPYVVRAVPRFQPARERILCPTVHFRRGEAHVGRALLPLGQTLGAGAVQTLRAVAKGFAAQRAFRAAVEASGRAALATLQDSGEPGIVLVGRPYNVHDRAINLDVPGKLRDFYGINVVPMDCLPLGDLDIRDVNDNMYWHTGRRILAAGKLVGSLANLHIVYITNFKCGPDSYLKHFLGAASGKPYLNLQFDGHNNDAGMLTRCEAYLDSKGMLRWWQTPARA
ncbi:MAG TPA: acyl-CoA dehydratase activase [Candidatus Methylomirabilis sp.]|nr:acyl-CoA dehydratase activase [Candidatus Methylomirabilis sp.]